MAMPRLTPALTPESNRFKRPWRDSSRTSLVPLWTPRPEGQLLEGRIIVPARLAHTQQHTNERLEFDRIIRENLGRWTEWRRQRGWEIASTPKIRGPVNPPDNNERRQKQHLARAISVLGTAGSAQGTVNTDHSEDVVWYFAVARFKRTEPVYARLDDILYLRDLHTAYGEPTGSDVEPAAIVEEDSGGWVNPMQFAQQRREARGLKRSDYLFGPLWEAL